MYNRYVKTRGDHALLFLLVYRISFANKRVSSLFTREKNRYLVVFVIFCYNPNFSPVSISLLRFRSLLLPSLFREFHPQYAFSPKPRTKTCAFTCIVTLAKLNVSYDRILETRDTRVVRYLDPTAKVSFVLVYKKIKILTYTINVSHTESLRYVLSFASRVII